jgi:hypothetical protein
MNMSRPRLWSRKARRPSEPSIHPADADGTSEAEDWRGDTSVGDAQEQTAPGPARETGLEGTEAQPGKTGGGPSVGVWTDEARGIARSWGASPGGPQEHGETTGSEE